jgi:hypothetical protein
MCNPLMQERAGGSGYQQKKFGRQELLAKSLRGLQGCVHSRPHALDYTSISGTLTRATGLVEQGRSNRRQAPMARAPEGPDLTHAFLALILIGAIVLVAALLLLA